MDKKPQQVVVIHGGWAYHSYNDFLQDLKSKKVEARHLKPGADWKKYLQDGLGEEFEVFAPQMPNKQNAQYNEWKIWFEKILPLLDTKLILIGHSLGGIFLVKYLSEERVDKDILGTFLVAAPFDEEDATYQLGGFTLPESFEIFKEQSRIIGLYFSTDDPSVPFADLAKYQAKLPYARASVFGDRGHFNQETFPELVEDIKALG